MIYIVKATGQKEYFSIEKVKKSCLRAGASPELANEIAQRISRQVKNNMSTKEIWRLILRYLGKESPIVASKFSLRDALVDLGPDGFAFEKLIAKIFEHGGYQTRVDQTLVGKCISHEIDIILEKGSETSTVECKFHHIGGCYTEIKDVLYTWARFLDIKEANPPFNLASVWLVSNTKFSEQCKEFAKCRGMKLLGWSYPEEQSLQNIIEKNGLYPITILRRLEEKYKDRLINEGIILCEDLLKIESRSFQAKTGLDSRKISILQNEAEQILRQK